LRTEPARATKSSGRAVLLSLGIVLLVVVLFVGVTSLTGFPGPGGLRRYPASDLTALVKKLNSEPPPELSGSSPSLRSRAGAGHAHVDWVRSRVVITGMICFGAGPLALSPTEARMIENQGALAACAAASAGP
jgi:hypothetical protein